MANILNQVKSPCASNRRLDKSSVQKLLDLVMSDCERECTRYALFKASGMTQTQVRREIGFENMNDRTIKVEAFLREAQKVREAIDDLTGIQGKALLATLGLHSDSDDPLSTSDEAEIDTSENFPNTLKDSETATPDNSTNTLSSIVSVEEFKSLLTASKYNLFEVVEIIEQSLDDSLKDQVPSYLDILIREPSSLRLSEGERQLLLQAKEASDAAAKDLIS